MYSLESPHKKCMREKKQQQKKKKNAYTGMSEKWGLSHTNQEKNGVSHILFVEKRGLIIYMAALKKGAIRHAHPYYAI